MTIGRSRRADAARNVLAGTLAKYAMVVVSMAIGVVMLPFTVSHLGRADYGLWMLAASLTSYFQLLDLGYGNGVVRHITEADARGDVEGMNQVLSTFVVVYAVIGAAAFIGVLMLAAFVVPRFPHLTGQQIRMGQIVLVVLGLRLAVGFPMTVFGAVSNARQRFAINSWVAVGVAIVNALVTYVVLVNGYGLATLVPASVTVSLLSYLAYATVARRAFPAMRFSVSLFSWKRLREVTSFSMYLFLINIAAHIGFNLDNVVLAGFLGTTAVAVYAVASRLADYQRQLCNQFNGLLFPVLADFHARGDRAALRTTLLDGTRLAVALVAGITVPLLVFAGPLIRSWMGPGFEDAVPALYALAIAGVVLVGQGPLGNILLVVGRHRLVAFGALAEALLNLALSLILVRAWGIAGVALGTMLAVLSVNLVVLVPVACRALGIGPLAFARHAVRPSLLAGLPATATAWALRSLIVPDSLLLIVACGAVVGLVYVATFALVALDLSDRARYAEYLRRLTGGVRVATT